MKIIVQKFGGTSVSNHENRKLVVNKVLSSIKNGYSPIVVVSAMGRKGQPYATDTLLSLISDDLKEKNPLVTDSLMSCGEIISTAVICDELAELQINSVPLTGGQTGIITDENYTNASVLKVETDNIFNILKQGKVPVVAGFQGISSSGFVTTLGRGGSDVTAALLGAAVNAEKIEIFTDVDGIMTADPRIVRDASLIEEISYNEVFQFADQGAKVIHPRAVEIAMRANIPLVIKNTMSECNGTIICSNSTEDSSSVITGITHMKNRDQIKISYEDNKDNSYYFEILDSLANNMISIDLINVFPKEKIFTIDHKDFKKFQSLMIKMKIKYTFLLNCSKIAVIGSRMRGIPGVMAKILRTLVRANIEVLQTADSHTTIWCLVEDKDAEKAINALHKEFKLGQ
ncbi:aspartate kinase [Clostridium sp. JN-9]|uniref:aspartate kinase n=1 Tax=Clostridium sp. JN-9 TaxID=2507159 RepID=UPI000FFE1F9D|nr:aspartate kinase [Clostridium sp. JN-9]QAT40212.1 aspartate kinase [Clostridium sp. JN-9]